MMALDSIAKALNLTWSQKNTWKSDITETTIRIPSVDSVKEYHVTLLKPRKLMNISGSCVAQAGNINICGHMSKKKKKLTLFISQGSFNSVKKPLCVS